MSNLKEIESQVEQLRLELKNSTKITELISKFKQINELINSYAKISNDIRMNRENSIKALLKEEVDQVEKLIYSVINKDEYSVEVKLRSVGNLGNNYHDWQNYHSYNRVFKFTSKGPNHEWVLPEKKEHDWEVEPEKREIPEEDFVFGFGPFGMPFPTSRKEMFEFYKKREKERNLCDKSELDKVNLSKDGTSTASFSSEKMMQDLVPIQKIFAKILSIMDDTDSKLKKVENDGESTTCRSGFYMNFERVLYEFVHTHNLKPGKKTFKIPFSKDGVTDSNPNIAKVTQQKVHMILGEGTGQVLAAFDINNVIWHLFKNNIKSGDEITDLGNSKYTILEINNDEIKFQHRSQTKTQNFGKFVYNLLTH